MIFCLHNGTPTGKIQAVGGVETCIALPANEDYPKDKAIIFCADLFGIKFVNNQLLCDVFARALGIAVYAPDYLHDDAVTDDMFTNPSWNIARDWLPPVHPWTLSSRYCFGGRYSTELAQDNAVHVAVTSYPSLLKTPGEFIELFERSAVPLLVNSCEVRVDDGRRKMRWIVCFWEGKYAPGYEPTYWPGCKHGFALRGDVNNPHVKAGKEGAFKASVD